MSKGKRGRKRKIKLKISPASVTSALSISLIVGGALIIVAFFAPGYRLNAVLVGGVKSIAGWIAFLIPLILIQFGFLLNKAVKLKFVNLRILFGLIILLFGLTGLFHMFYETDVALEHAKDGIGGGIVGYQLFLLLSNTVGVIGGTIIQLGLIAVAIVFLTDRPFDVLLKDIKESPMKSKLKNAFSFKKKKAGELDDLEATVTETDHASLHGENTQEQAVQHIPIDLPDPVFEVIPSMSEPQAEMGKIRFDENSRLVSLAPNILPYNDKVWELPPLDLLDDPPNKQADRGDVEKNKATIINTLENFNIKVTIPATDYGPTVTRYALAATPGTRISAITGYHSDLALALASPSGSVRIEAPIPGKSLIGVEVPNNTRQNVTFKEVFVSDAMKGIKSKLAIVLGKDVGGQPMVYDIAKMPHLLVAGATGSGKSVFLHSIMASLLYRCTPEECKFILVDPKRVELVHYQDIPHLLTPVITDIDKASAVIKGAVAEMEKRYKMFETSRTKNIDQYNEKSGFQALPYIVIIVDELGEIMVADPAAVEKSIIRLAQLARATGIHLILATQRPTTNIVTGTIKANIPARISFNVTSNIDSRVIIDMAGAEKLVGKGDMLFVPPESSKPVRIQGTWVSEVEMVKLVNYLKSLGVEPDFNESILNTPVGGSKPVSQGGTERDSKFDEAIEAVVEANKASTSFLQRRLGVGYSRAARLMDELEDAGIVAPADGNKARTVHPPIQEGPVSPSAPSLNPSGQLQD